VARVRLEGSIPTPLPLLVRAHSHSDTVVSADLLHDVLEKSDTTLFEIRAHYRATLRLLEQRDPAPPFLESLEEELRLLHRERLSV
jgi:hypothetical protein